MIRCLAGADLKSVEHSLSRMQSDGALPLSKGWGHLARGMPLGGMPLGHA